jgi:hypothetical protein
MRYYFLKNGTGPEVGCVPQTDGVGGTVSLKEVATIRWFKETAPVSLDYIRLHNRAKVTDFISSALFPSAGFLISRRTEEILMRHNIGHHQFLPAVVVKKDKRYDHYCYFHFVEDNTKQIVFEKCVLSTFRPLPYHIEGWNYEYERVSISNHDEYAEHWKNMIPRNFTTENLVLAKQLMNRDLITISGFERPVIISENLKEDLKLAGITGYELSDVPFSVEFL